MKLQLKHLSSYLPYGLTVKNEAFRIDHNNQEFGILNGIYPLYKGDEVFYQYTTKTNSTGSSFNNCKLILKPLSDLSNKDVADITEYSDIENVVFSGNPDSLYFVNTEEKTYLDDYADVMEFLFKNHFDVYGLIEKGLAIDINTIK